MFDFLNKLTHNHTPPPVAQVQFEDLSSENQDNFKPAPRYEPTKEEQISQKNSSQVIKKPKASIQSIKKVKKVESRITKMQYGGKAQLEPHVMNIFKGLLNESKKHILIHQKKGTSQIISEKINSIRSEKQRNVYIRQMSKSQSQYLDQASHFVTFQNNFVKETIGSTIYSIIQQISQQIEEKQYTIRMQGQKIPSGDNHKLQTLVKIKKHQNELQNKIGQLSIDLDMGHSIIEKRAKQIVEKDGFNPDSHKTKLAQEFVRQKQRERQQIKIKIEEFKQRKRSIEIRSQEQQQQRAKRQKQQKHQKLKNQFLEKKRLRQQRQSKARTQQKQYKQFLKDYKISKPLYQIKQEQFKQKQKEQRIQKYHVLRQKQKLFAPIDLETIEMHSQRYEQLRQEDRMRKQAQLDLLKKQNMLRKKQLQQKAYKGKFRYIILKQMVEQENRKKQKEQEKQRILMRKQAYSLQVKEKYKPQIDIAKKRQIQQIINSHKNTKRKYLTPNRVAFSQRYSTIKNIDSYSEPQANPKQQGRKYHRQFKQYIREKVQKGQVKDEQQSIVCQTIKPKVNYLKELREKYESIIPSQSARLQRQISNLKEGDDCSVLIMKAQEYERKAKQREIKLRNVAHRPQEQARLEQQYLCAIKAKISLIDKMD